MNKHQKKIVALVYKNAENGISIEEIAKKLKISPFSLSLEVGELLKINALEEFPGKIIKPSSKKLTMM